MSAKDFTSGIDSGYKDADHIQINLLPLLSFYRFASKKTNQILDKVVFKLL